MEVYPAIDIRGGNCVRLKQGDYGQETLFGNDPAEMAGHWVSQGAHRLHIVDLDGARSGHPENLATIGAILKNIEIPCQIGGGIRDETTIAKLLELGVYRVVIGTKAVKDPDWFRQMCHKFPGKLVLGIDARNNLVAAEGWQETSTITATELAEQFADEPFAAIVCTDIATDGMLAGPNLETMRKMKQTAKHPLIASGGITTVDDVKDLAENGLDGCIIGRALYEGRIDLYEALVAAGDNPPDAPPPSSTDF